MPKTRTALEAAARKLLSAISKEWSAEAGEESGAATERVMHASHGLLAAAKNGSIASLVGSTSVTAYLGEQWVQSHPNVCRHIEALEVAQSKSPSREAIP